MGRGITKTIQKIGYLTPDEIITIHDEVLKRYGGGDKGIFPDGRGKLEVMIDRMKEGYFGHQPFDTLVKKTSFMFQSILIYHPFIDGMKRTGIYSCLAFLLRNGYLFVSKGVEDSVNFAISVADTMGNIESEESLNIISNWFRERIISFDDSDAIVKHVTSTRRNFKCPRCANTGITFDDPICHDCGAQLVEYTIVIDGIVEERTLTIKREPEPPPPMPRRPRGLYP